MSERKFIELLAHDIDMRCSDKLHECEASYCPYFRYGSPETRDDVVDAITKKLSSDTIASLKDNAESPLVITSFASSALFQNLIIMLALSEHDDVRASRIELNPIDIRYEKLIASDKIADSELGQFNGFMHHLFPNITVFVYSSTRDYVEDVKYGWRPSSNIVWAIDFGGSNDEMVLCNLNSTLLSYTAANNHLEFRFPYEPEGAYVARYRGSLSKEQKGSNARVCNEKIALKARGHLHEIQNLQRDSSLVRVPSCVDARSYFNVTDKFL